MKKIISKSEKQKKDTRNKTIVGIILVMIMILSVMGYGFMNTDSQVNNEEENEKIKFGDIEFEKNNYDLWQTEISGYGFYFNYLPNETINVNTENISEINNYIDKPLYVYTENSGAGNQIIGNLGQFILRSQSACPDSDLLNEDGLSLECKENAPLKNCTNNFIVIKEIKGDIRENKIKQIKNCVVISGTEENLLKLSDEFLYKIIGIKT